VERGEYAALVSDQMLLASQKKGPGDLRALLRSGGTWQVS